MIQGAQSSHYSPEDLAFYKFWYGHMKDDVMAGPVDGVRHATARYIWDAALAATPPQPAPQQSEAGIPASVQQDRQDAEPVDTKLLVDIATGVMDEWMMLEIYDDKGTQRFCEQLQAAFDAALAARKEPKL
jgi:hypothetical protein